MLEKLREIEQLLIKQIFECEQQKGMWNGDDSTYLEDHANLYSDIQERLENSKKNLLEAIVLLNDNQ